MIDLRTAFPFATALLLAVTLGPAPAGAAAPAHRGPVECTAALDCDAETINLMTMQERLEFVQALSAGPATEIIPGYEPRWRNIEGIITFFRDEGMGDPGTWVSYVDAGILEGIERGLAIALGRGTSTFGNPGATRWSKYLKDLAEGRLSNRAAHDRAWSEAEQASTDRGVSIAEGVHGLAPSPLEGRFFKFSEFYRYTLRQRPLLLGFFSPEVGPGEQQQVTFFDWFTDVTNATPSYKGAGLAFELAEFDLPGGFFTTLALLYAYADELHDDYVAETFVP